MYATKKNLKETETKLGAKIDNVQKDLRKTEERLGTRIDTVQKDLKVEIKEEVGKLAAMINRHFYTKDEMRKNFYSKEEMRKNFYTKDEMSKHFYTKEDMNKNFYNKSEMDIKLKEAVENGIKEGLSSHRVVLESIDSKMDLLIEGFKVHSEKHRQHEKRFEKIESLL